VIRAHQPGSEPIDIPETIPKSGCGTQANTYSDGTRPQGASWDSGEGSPELLSVNGPINKGLMAVRA
jgi:hypothetical protein